MRAFLRITCAGALLAWTWVSQAGDVGAAPALDAGLADCAAHALPERSMRQVQDVTVISEAGWTRETSRKVLWKRFDDGSLRVLFRVERPKSEAGLSLLVIQRPGTDPVLYVHTPDIERARRVVGSGASNSVLGTDFTFEDAMHLQGFLAAEGVRSVGDAEVDGHPAMVAETEPDADKSAYSMIRTYIDKLTCLPMKTEFLGPNGSLDKTLVLVRDQVREIGGRAIPLRMIMFNHKQKQRTELTASEIEVDVELPDSLFTVAEIAQGP